MMTLQEIVEEVIRRLSEVPGLGTQVYAEERIVRLVNSAFKFIRTHAEWPELMQWYTRTLDGTTGKVTVPLINVLGPKDLKAVFPENSDRKLSILPTSINVNKLIGATSRWVQLLGVIDDPLVNDARYLFKVWPIQSTGNLNILVKHNRVWGDSHMEDEMWLDDEAIVLHCCMREANSDGANPAEQNDFSEQFKDRMRQLTRDNHRFPTELNPGGVTTPYTWFDPAEYY